MHNVKDAAARLSPAKQNWNDLNDPTVRINVAQQNWKDVKLRWENNQASADDLENASNEQTDALKAYNDQRSIANLLRNSALTQGVAETVSTIANEFRPFPGGYSKSIINAASAERAAISGVFGNSQISNLNNAFNDFNRPSSYDSGQYSGSAPGTSGMSSGLEAVQLPYFMPATEGSSFSNYGLGDGDPSTQISPGTYTGLISGGDVSYGLSATGGSSFSNYGLGDGDPYGDLGINPNNVGSFDTDNSYNNNAWQSSNSGSNSTSTTYDNSADQMNNNDYTPYADDSSDGINSTNQPQAAYNPFTPEQMSRTEQIREQATQVLLRKNQEKVRQTEQQRQAELQRQQQEQQRHAELQRQRQEQQRQEQLQRQERERQAQAASQSVKNPQSVNRITYDNVKVGQIVKITSRRKNIENIISSLSEKDITIGTITKILDQSTYKQVFYTYMSSDFGNTLSFFTRYPEDVHKDEWFVWQ